MCKTNVRHMLDHTNFHYKTVEKSSSLLKERAKYKIRINVKERTQIGFNKSLWFITNDLPRDNMIIEY